jgi:hypothetical protein
MLTDDGKHLYVSWDEYHMLIERLALKVRTRAGSSTRSCAWRAAACGRATCCRACSTSRWRSCPPVPTAPRPAPSRAGWTWPSTSPCPRANWPAACCWSTTWPTPATRCARWSSACAACRRSAELRAAVIWVKGVSSYTPDYYVECCPRARGSTSRSRNTTPAPGRAGEESSHDLQNETNKMARHRCAISARPSLTGASVYHLVPRKGLEPPRR